MRCDIVAVGTELLLGQIVDSNSAFIGERLAAHGIASHLHVHVGDHPGRIESVLRSVLADADAVIVCGGLGPTHDDVTRECIAAVMGVELVDDPAIAAHIAEMFARRNRPMSANNLRQAQVPAGATAIHNPRGTAPGLICPVGDRVIYAVPGVPSEMRAMIDESVLSDLRSRSGDTSAIVSRVLKTWGDSESGLNEKLDGVIAELDTVSNPTLAFLASGWDGLKIRLTARGDDTAAANALLDHWDARVRQIVGDTVFAVDDASMESEVLDLLRRRGQTLGLAESVTGGLVCGRLTAIPGASDVLRGGIVSYASEVKFDLLGVTPGVVVSEVAALEMAEGARGTLGADVGLALTGVAGPDEQDGMPVGTLCVAWSDGVIREATTLRLPGQRQQMREMSVISALDFLRRRLG